MQNKKGAIISKSSILSSPLQLHYLNKLTKWNIVLQPFKKRYLSIVRITSILTSGSL